jgi:hypothetical protein
VAAGTISETNRRSSSTTRRRVNMTSDIHIPKASLKATRSSSAAPAGSIISRKRALEDGRLSLEVEIAATLSRAPANSAKR